MTTVALVPVCTGNNGTTLCNAHDLHAVLESGQDFSDWIKNSIDKYGFIDGEDFSINFGKTCKRGGRPTIDYPSMLRPKSTERDLPPRILRRKKRLTSGNPCDFYADDAVWSVVYDEAVDELKDTMNIVYLTEQRPADVLKVMETDAHDGTFEVKQNKTKKRLRILLDQEDGTRTQFGNVIDRIRWRSCKVRSLYLVATKSGVPLNQRTLGVRCDAAHMRL